MRWVTTYSGKNSPCRLVHAVNELSVGGTYSMIIELAGSLPGYRQILVHETPPGRISQELVTYAQMNGLDVLQADLITPDTLKSLDCDILMMHNLVGASHGDLGVSVPSLYYNYGYLENCRQTVDMACSELAREIDRSGKWQHRVAEYAGTMPPLVNVRNLRRLSGPPGPFTVGLLTSGRYAKYPCELAMHVLERAPDDIGIMLTSTPEYPHPGMQMAIDAAREKRKGMLAMCPIHPSGGIHYTVRLDIAVFGSAPGTVDPYGRMLVEAMAMGKAIVAQRKQYQHLVEHEYSGMLFDTPDEAVEHIGTLYRNRNLIAQLGANAQLRALAEDAAVHIGLLKGVLRSL